MIVGGPVDFGPMIWVILLGMVLLTIPFLVLAGLIAYGIARQKIADPVGVAAFVVVVVVVAVVGLDLPGIGLVIAVSFGLLASVFVRAAFAAARRVPTSAPEHLGWGWQPVRRRVGSGRVGSK